MTHLTIYSRPGCHLCDDMKAIVERVGASVPVTVEEIDISGNARLEALYGLEIPVLMLEGKKAAKFRVSEPELRQILAGRITVATTSGTAAATDGTVATTDGIGSE